MRDHGSERSEVLDLKNERPRQPSASGLRELLKGPRVPTFVGNAKETEGLASVKGRWIYGLSDKKTIRSV